MKRKDLLILIYVSIGTALYFFLFVNEDKSFRTFFLTLGISAMYTLFLGFGNHFVNEFLNRKFPWSEVTSKRAAISIISLLIINFILVYFCNFMNFVVFQKVATPQQFLAGKYNFVNWFMINLTLLISAFLHAKAFIQELKKNTKKEVVEQKLIAKSANAQFESLKNQLDPHFLFNSLNVLSSLIDENPKQAQKFTSSMSKIYRYVLEQKDKELVTVQDEMDFAKTYCELLKTRFEDSVDFKFEVNETHLRKFVVPLSLQLLLENCIKHNFATSAKPLVIKVFTENSSLCIENNLQARQQIKESAGIGLANIVQRYSLLTPKNVFIEKSESHFKVKLPILEIKPLPEKPKELKENFAYERAHRRVKELKGFYSNLTSYLVVNTFLIILNLVTSPNRLWFYWSLIGWGIGVISHGMSVFSFGRSWEEKKIRDLMQKK